VWHILSIWHESFNSWNFSSFSWVNTEEKYSANREAFSLSSSVYSSIHRVNIPPPKKKKSYIPKNLSSFYIFGPRIIIKKSILQTEKPSPCLPVFILGIHRGNIPPPQKKSYIPKNLSSFYIFGPRIIHCYKKLTMKLLFNFNNFNSRLPASSQHHIKYFNTKKAHPCVIPRILSHHASKSVKSFDLCACLRKKWNKKLSASGGFAPRPLGPDQGLCPATLGAQPLDPRYLPPKLAVPPPKLGVCTV